MLSPMKHPRAKQNPHAPTTTASCGGAACLVAALAACAGPPAPRAQVAAAHVTEVSPDAVGVEFLLEVEQAGGSPLPLREVHYTLRAGDRTFRASRSPEATLPPGGRIAFAMPAAVVLEAGAAPAEVPYRLDVELVYFVNRPLAKALYDGNVHRPSVSLRDEGVIDLRPSGAGGDGSEGADGGEGER